MTRAKGQPRQTGTWRRLAALGKQRLTGHPAPGGEVIIPLGFSLGPQHYYVRPPIPHPETHEVHLGGDMLDLSADEFAVYRAASADVPGHSRLRVDRTRLTHALQTSYPPHPRAAFLVDRLIHRGLLLEYDPDGDLKELFGRHRLFPTAEGMGSTPDEPHQHRMGHHNRPLVAVGNTAYVMWAFSFLHPNLWHACDYLARADEEEREPDEKPIGLTPHTVAREVATAIPVMIATGVAFLDPVVTL